MSLEAIKNNSGALVHQISHRREAITRLSAIGLVVTGAISLAGVAAKRIFLHAPSRPTIVQPEGKDIYPGWIGASQPIFFDSERGPEKFIRLAVMENPILREIAGRILKDFDKAYHAKRRFGLDEIYRLGLNHTHDVFGVVGSSRLDQQVDRPIEELVAGTVAIGFACSGWPAAMDYRRLGVFKNLPKETNPYEFFWVGENSVGRTILPRVMPDPRLELSDQPREEPSNGEDGTRHFTMFVALHQLILSSLEQQSGLEKSTPRILTKIADFLLHKKGIRSNTSKAAFLVELAGVFYELKSTLKPSSLPWPGKDLRSIKSGWFDPMVRRDLEINAIAIRFSKLLRMATERSRIIYGAREQLINELKDPYLSHLHANTILDGLLPGTKPKSANHPN